MLSFQYAITKEDYINYYTFIVWDAPQNKKKRWTYYLKQVIPILFFTAAFYYTGLFRRDSMFIFVIAGFLILTSLLSLLGARTNLKRQADKIVNNPDNSAVFLPGTLTVSETGITLKNELLEIKYQWKAIIKKQETAQYYFLFVSATQALIIPKRIFVSTEEKIQFGKLLQQQLSFEAELGDFLKS